MTLAKLSSLPKHQMGNKSHHLTSEHQVRLAGLTTQDWLILDASEISLSLKDERPSGEAY